MVLNMFFIRARESFLSVTLSVPSFLSLLSPLHPISSFLSITTLPSSERQGVSTPLSDLQNIFYLLFCDLFLLLMRAHLCAGYVRSLFNIIAERKNGKKEKWAIG